MSWAVGLVLGGVAIGFGPAGLVPFLVAGAILGSGLGRVQVADRVLMSLLVPMVIGLWLVWPVRDDWAGSGETDLPPGMGPIAPPERLSPAGIPPEPR